jgi:hypothetical protein
VQATVNSIHSALRSKSASRGAQVWTAARRAEASVKSKERIAVKKTSTGGRKRGESGHVSEATFQTGFCNLLPNATKRSEEAGSVMSLNYSFVRGCLVDLIGIEPMTSSMPWKRAPSCATGPLSGKVLLLLSRMEGLPSNGCERSADRSKRYRHALRPARECICWLRKVHLLAQKSASTGSEKCICGLRAADESLKRIGLGTICHGCGV